MIPLLLVIFNSYENELEAFLYAAEEIFADALKKESTSFPSFITCPNTAIL
ncbi:MAG: hypothetical protein SO386_04970 [Eubacteriales bacterium]|nr:hypothetical protein [Eubacteriales bacterium]